MSDDLKERVRQFNALRLPGQPLGMHMGTSYLVNDLAKRITDLEAQLAEAQRQNELLRDACEDALLRLQEDYAMFDFDLWRESWGKPDQLHFGEKLMSKLQAAIDGGALEDNDEH